MLLKYFNYNSRYLDDFLKIDIPYFVQLINQTYQTEHQLNMVCAYVREDNPRALASGLFPVHTHNHTITALLHQHACAICAL